MQKLAVVIAVVLSFVLSGCDDVTDITQCYTDSDKLSEILYTSEADVERSYSIHESMAELFDNVSDANLDKTTTKEFNIEENNEIVVDSKEATQSTNETEEAVTTFAIVASDTVWISASGKKYHSKSDCSGMKSAEAVTKHQAELDGYTACKRCY